MSKSVFFIDDDENYLYLLERITKKIDAISEVYTAKNGSDALQKLESWCANGEKLPDVMFVDVSMPVMDGFEFLEVFKAKREEIEALKKIIPIIMLTSSLHEADQEKALAFGVAEKYMTKPDGIKATESMLAEIVQ